MRYGHYFLSRIYANLGLRWADEGTENKISHSFYNYGRFVVGVDGFEPPTLCL